MDTLTKLAGTVGKPFRGHLNFRFEVEEASEEEMQTRTRIAIREFMAQHGAIPSTPSEQSSDQSFNATPLGSVACSLNPVEEPASDANTL